jgi:Spy/CpxP family protein refolding chaperone
MKSKYLLTFLLSGAMAISVGAVAQRSNSAADNGNNATTQNGGGQRGQRFAEALNLTPEQQTDLKSIHENERQQAQAIKNDSSLTADQKKAKFKELRKSSREQMMAKLTPEQQQKFKEMHKGHRGHWRGGKKNQDQSTGETPQG